MAIVRAIALKDATGTALTSCGTGTAFDIGGVSAGQSLYAGLHVLSSSTGGLLVRVQGSSSSGFGAGKVTSHVAFTERSCRNGQWATPLTTGTVTSTFQSFWRAEWGMTTSGESYLMLPWMSIE